MNSGLQKLFHRDFNRQFSSLANSRLQLRRNRATAERPLAGSLAGREFGGAARAAPPCPFSAS